MGLRCSFTSEFIMSRGIRRIYGMQMLTTDLFSTIRRPVPLIASLLYLHRLTSRHIQPSLILWVDRPVQMDGSQRHSFHLPPILRRYTIITALSTLWGVLSHQHHQAPSINRSAGQLLFIPPSIGIFSGW